MIDQLIVFYPSPRIFHLHRELPFRMKGRPKANVNYLFFPAERLLIICGQSHAHARLHSGFCGAYGFKISRYLQLSKK